VVQVPLPDRSLRPAFTGVFPGESEPYGLSYGQWLAKGLQMTWSIPPAYNSVAESTAPQNNNNCAVGQTDPVWFLGISGTIDGGTHRCLIPHGTAVMTGFSFINYNVPYVCGQGASLSAKELLAQINESLDSATNVSITIDGATVPNVANRFRVTAPTFWLAQAKDQFGNETCPPNDQIPPGVYSPSTGAGFVVILKPLALGAHLIKIHTEFPGFRTFDDTYEVTVVPVRIH
jgi:hypothetical protein